MKVSHILQEKGRDVVTVAATVTIAEATKLLAAKRIGAVIVRDGGGAVGGILSERDIVRALAKSGADCLSHKVADHMTRDVVTCSEADSVDDLMEQMTRGRFRHLPVVEDRQLIGIVSIGDVVKTRIAETVFEAESLRAYIATG
jgi:CBS domain-containing protein